MKVTRTEMLAAAAALLLSAWPAAAQQVMSAQSGTIHYTEGRVELNESKIQAKTYGPFTQLKEGDTLTTRDGKAELLLNPGVFLRMGENSAVTMMSSRLTDTKVRIERGDVLVEVADLMKDNSVTLLYKDVAVEAAKKGIYRFDTEANMFRVYAGEAQVKSAEANAKLKSGRQVALNGALAETKFDKKDSDAFLSWNQGRDGYMSLASVSTARGMYRNGYSLTSAGWYYDPLFGSFGYVPYRGYFMSPFGFYYYSPGTSWTAYSPVYGHLGNSNNGWGNSGGFGNQNNTPSVYQGNPAPSGHTSSTSMPSSMPSMGNSGGGAPSAPAPTSGAAQSGGGSHRAH